MPTTISEVRHLCPKRGLDLPEVRHAALATDGTPAHTGEVMGVDAFRTWSALRALHDRTVLCLTQARHGHEVPALLNWLGACIYGITAPSMISRRPRTPHSVATAALEQ